VKLYLAIDELMYQPISSCQPRPIVVIPAPISL